MAKEEREGGRRSPQFLSLSLLFLHFSLNVAVAGRAGASQVASCLLRAIRKSRTSKGKLRAA